MEQKKSRKSFIILFTVFCMCCVLLIPLCFAGCSNETYITKIEKTDTVGLVDYYTITYSDGTTSTFTITNGEDGSDGQDAENVTIDDIYEKYKEVYGEDLSYADFLKEYLSVSVDDSQVINYCLQSSLKIYSEFYVTGYSQTWPPQLTDTVSMSGGSGVIYKMNDDYTYVVTNYHVIYNQDANDENGSKFARRIVGYLYGSESSPVESGTDNNGYPNYDYGDYGIEFELVGGSIEYDIAVLKVETSRILEINPNAKAVTLADGYHVGETAIAIGNPEGYGISASQGIVSVDNEYISLSIDNTSRVYRCLRIDTAIYHGSSGGGLFNSDGELIGITNAGAEENQNINYAIPIEIVQGVADNILYYYNGENTTEVHKISLGVTVSGTNSKYVYDEISGYGNIIETINITEVTEGSIAETIGLQSGDIIKSITINDVTYELNRYFEIGDILLTIRADDKIIIDFERDGSTYQTTPYTVQTTDLGL